MPLLLEELDKRLTELEREMICLRQLVERQSQADESSREGAPDLRDLLADQAAIDTAIAAAFAQMGVSGEPIGAANVRAMIAAGGVKPEGNEFSRGIIEMREE